MRGDRVGIGQHLVGDIDDRVGSTFIAAIPAMADPPIADHRSPDLPATDHRGQQPAEAPPTPTRTLLYIEDNSSNIALMKQLVGRRAAWNLTLADHGAAGLKLARNTAPDLVLLDMHLPDMNGNDILHALRSDPTTRDLTVVMVSADANPHTIERLLAAGADDYLTKPLNIARLLGILDSSAGRAITS